MVRALLLLVALVGAACAPVPAGPTPEAPRDAGLVRVTLLLVNDIYVLEPVDGGRRGGVARLATLVREARHENPGTLFVLAGDLISPSVMSSVFRGAQMIAAFNAVGLDLATFGNHEFDFGPEVLAERMRESTFAWVSTNVLDRRTGQPFGGARREEIRTLRGIPVGFVGLTTPATAATSSPGAGVVFTNPRVAGREGARSLRERGAKVVVAITHQDLGEDRALAEAADVDLVLGGHEHEPLVAEEGKALIVKAGSDGRYLVRVDLWLTPGGRLVERSWAFREVSARVSPDPGVEALVAAYVARLDRELDVVIGETTVPLDARGRQLRTGETNLGSFVADVVRARAHTHVALVNGGGIRTDRMVPAGPLTRRDVRSLLPFNNVVMNLELSGRDLRAVLEHGLAQADRAAGGFLQASGLRLAWDPAKPPGDRLARVEVGDKPLDDDARYTVAVPSFLYRGGDGFTMLARGRILVAEEHGPDLTVVVMDAIAERRQIAPAADGRLTRMDR